MFLNSCVFLMTVNKPLVFESLKFYCTGFAMFAIFKNKTPVTTWSGNFIFKQTMSVSACKGSCLNVFLTMV